jgi:hypothetical protein
MTADGTPPALSLQELRNSAELLEREVVALHRATDAELDARRPQADVPAAALASAWFAYAVWLAERKGGAAAKADRPIAQVLHESLADEPAVVTLRNGQSVRIHAKSLNTLLVLEGIDADLRQLLRQLAAVQGDTDPLDGVAGAELVQRLLVSASLRHFVWVLDHPGPGLPFDMMGDDAPPPDWTAELHSDDLERIWLAHLQVNRRDIEFLAAAFPSDSAAERSRLPLSGFLGAQAAEDGVAPKVYLFDRSLRSIFASCIARAETHRQAMAAARRDGGGA